MSKDSSAAAERLHSACIRLLRRVRIADTESGLSPPKLSALSVLVFGGPQSLTSLARAEQVRAPTMSKLVAELEAGGLVAKKVDGEDKRAVRIEVTVRGRALMEEGRKRRLAVLRKLFSGLSAADLAVLNNAASLMLRVSEA